MRIFSAKIKEMMEIMKEMMEIIKRIINMKKMIVACTAISIIFASLFAPLSFAFAETMSSAQYKMQSDSINFAGGNAESQSYKISETVGEVGTGDLTSAAYTFRAGFQQVEDPSARTISTGVEEVGGSAPTPSTVNVIDFKAEALEKSILLSWKYPENSGITSVTIVRSTKFFPVSVTDGEIIYVGEGEKVVDNDVVPGVRYYYTIFAKSSLGTFSSGALATVQIYADGKVRPGEDPFANLPQAENVDPAILKLSLKDFDFIQDGKSIIPANSALVIDAKKNLTVKLDYKKVPEVLKTIAVTFGDPDDSSKVFTFLLRANKDKTAYEATVGALGRAGLYKLNITILDYINQSLKRISGDLKALVLKDGQSLSSLTFGKEQTYAVFIFLIIAFIACLIFVTLEKRKREKIVASLLIFILTGGLALGFFSPKRAHADVSLQINYQGKLANYANKTVNDGAYHARFKLYSLDGTLLWTETKTVAVTNGLFSTLLGDITAFTGVDFNQTLYLGIEIGGSGAVASWDGEMSPRKKIGAVPAAFVADTLDGLDSTQFLRSDTGVASQGYFLATSTTATSTFSGAFVVSGLSTLANLLVTGSSTLQNFTALNSTSTNATTTSIFSTTASSTNLFSSIANLANATISNLTVNGPATSTFAVGLAVQTNKFVVEANSGNVGIGTTTPWGKLSVSSPTSASAPAFVISTSTASATSTAFIVDANGKVGIGGTTTPTYDFSVKGTSYLDGNLYLGGSGDSIIFSGPGNHDIVATSGTLRIGSNTIIGNIEALDSTVDIGTAATRFDKIYANEVNASTIVGTLTGGNLTAETFAINSDNGTNDTEDANLAFHRGLSSPNALMTWDSTNDEFDFNAPFHLTGTLGSANGIVLDGYTTDITTASNQHLVITPNGTGNVGIGTTTPWRALSVHGSSDLGINALAGYFTATSSTASVFPYASTTALSSTGSAYFATSGGSVGIGTTSPWRALSVSGSGVFTGGDVLASTFTATSSISTPSLTLSSVAINSLLSTDASGVITATSTPTFGYFNATSTNATSTIAGGLAIETSGFVYDYSSGNVGIGTAAPSATVADRRVLHLYDSTDAELKIEAGNVVGRFFNDGSSLFGFGLDTAHDLRFFTSGGSNSRIEIKADGKVGIGTTSPWGRLSVTGSGATSATYGLVVADSNNSPKMVVRNDGNVGIGTTSPGQTLSVAGDILGNNIIGQYFTATSSTATSTIAGGLAIETSGFVYDYSSGNVGIGTAAPSGKLHVVHTSDNDGLYVSNLGTGLNSGRITLQGRSSTLTFGATSENYGAPWNDLVYMVASSNASGGMRLGTQTSAPIIFQTDTGDKERMRISDTTGYVGIATTSPWRALSVHGSSDLGINALAGYFTATSTTASVFPYASTTALTVSGTAYFAGSGIWNSSGNVGIGTTSPWAELSISNAVSGTEPNIRLSLDETTPVNPTNRTMAIFPNMISTVFTNNQAANAPFFIQPISNAFDTKVTVGTTTLETDLNTTMIVYGSGASTNRTFATRNSNNTETFTILDSGNVGIGTTTPGAKLEIFNVGTGGAGVGAIGEQLMVHGGQPSIVFQDNSATANRDRFIHSNEGVLSIGRAEWTTVVATDFVINETGSVGIGTTTPGQKLSVAGDILGNNIIGKYFTATSTTASVFPYASTTAMTVSDTAYFPGSGIWNSSGNVGIGTTSPGQKLSVAGDILGNNIIGKYFTATSTTASVFPYASTTALTVSGTSGLTLGTLNGPLHANNGAVSATTSVGTLYGGTGLTSYATGDLLYGSATDVLSKLTASTDGYVLALSSGLPSWVASTTLSTITGTLSIDKGGTNATSFGTTNGMVYYNGTSLVNDADLTFDGTTLTAAAGATLDLNSTSLSIADTSITFDGASTDFAFTGDWTVNTDDLKVLKSTGLVGISTTSPWRTLSVHGSSDLGINALAGYFTATSTTASVFPYASTTAISSSGAGYINNLAVGTYAAAGQTAAPANGLIVSGNVGIGTTSPVRLLSISGSSWSDSQGGNVVVASTHTTGSALTIDSRGAGGRAYSWLVTGSGASAGAGKMTLFDNSAGNYRLTVDSTGNVGIGTTSPLYKLSVQNTSEGNTFQIYDTDGNCLLDPDSGGITTTCSSDIRLKTDIVNANSALPYLTNIPIKDYTVIASGDRRTGVVAQELLTDYPELVHMGADGLYGVSEISTWKLIKGIQELDTRSADFGRALTIATSSIAEINALLATSSSVSTAIETNIDFELIASTTIQSLLESESFIDKIMDVFMNKLSDLGVTIGQAFTRITSLFVGTIHVEDKLCVDDVCINKDQLKALLISASTTPTSPPVSNILVPTPTSTPMPEVIISAPVSTPTPILIPTSEQLLATTTTSTSTPSTTPILVQIATTTASSTPVSSPTPTPAPVSVQETPIASSTPIVSPDPVPETSSTPTPAETTTPTPVETAPAPATIEAEPVATEPAPAP